LLKSIIKLRLDILFIFMGACCVSENSGASKRS
jgi:hypothetical protein